MYAYIYKSFYVQQLYKCDFMAKVIVCKENDVQLGSMKAFALENGLEIVIANIGNKFYAMNAACNHAQGPLAEGTLEGSIITCPWHGAKWDATNGSLIEFALDLDLEQTYKAEVENGNVIVEI